MIHCMNDKNLPTDLLATLLVLLLFSYWQISSFMICIWDTERIPIILMPSGCTMDVLYTLNWHLKKRVFTMNDETLRLPEYKRT